MSQTTTSTTPGTLSLSFDFLSPFSYLAFTTIHTHPLFNNPNSPVKIIYQPAHLPSLLRKAQNPPPVQPGRISLKQNYLVRDFQRQARILGVPVIAGFPKGFPIALDTRLQLRIILVLKHEYPTSPIHISAIEAFYSAIWRDGKDFSTPESTRENVIELLLGLLKNDKSLVEEILNKAEKQEIVAELEGNVQQVFEEGGFGLPWIKATNGKGESDTWWGVDHLSQAAAFLELAWPEGADKKEQVRWML